MPSDALSPAQAHALLDILVHRETYAEIQAFKYPGAIKEYGPPFDDSTPSTSPVLQGLLSRFVLTLPGLRDVSDVFWQGKVQDLIEELGAAELSESYDKGSLGARKTLATAISSVIEYPARGFLGGYPKKDVSKEGREYDKKNPTDLIDAWNDFIQEAIYGDMIDRAFEKTKETDNLEEHPPVVQAAHAFIVANLATFLHHIFVLTPDGQYLARVIDNIHKLVPYSIIRQTLRVGNAATMINGMVRLLLTKMSVSTITNFIGLTNSDSGTNMLQQIIATVIGWDISEFQKRSAKIEKCKERPSQQHLDCIHEYIKQDRAEHERCRTISQTESKSIVQVIFESAEIEGALSEEQHKQALEYLSIHLSIRDRDELRRILCYHHPDLITQGIRDCVAAYDPIIRTIHTSYDLSAGITDLENFLGDLLPIARRTAKSNNGTSPNRDGEPAIPSVEEFIQLLEKHQGSLHRFLHQLAKNGGEMVEWYREYAHQAASRFRRPEAASESENAAGTMTQPLNKIFATLSEADRKKVLLQLDAYVTYLDDLSASSAARMNSVIMESKGDSAFGPGMYLSRWQQTLDETPITPATAEGPVRKGGDRSVREHGRLHVDEDKVKKVERVVEKMDKKTPRAPEVGDVVRLLGPKFREDVLGKECML